MTEVDQAARPAPPAGLKPGMRWEARPHPGAGIAVPGTTCRYKLGAHDRACGAPAVLYVRRGVTTKVRWHYDAEHAARYGCWVEGGRVMHWVQVPEEQEDG